MNITVGTTRISEQQRFFLDHMRHPTEDQDRVDAIVQIALDSEIANGTEELHPEWIDYWDELKSNILHLVPAKLAARLQDFFSQITRHHEGLNEINPAESRICFLLGAGASKPEPSGIPTVKELLPDLLNRARRLDREEVTKLAEFCEESGIDNIEDLLTAAQIAEFCGRSPTVLRLIEFLLFREDGKSPVRRARRGAVDVASIAFLQDTLQVLFGLLSSRMLPAKPNHGHIAIADFVNANEDSRIVTTNYDCLMDIALDEAEVPFTYALDFANASDIASTNRKTIELVKLHGSLNWFYCEACQKIHRINIRQTVDDYMADRALYPVIGVCRTCGGQQRGLLVPPLAMKFDVAPALNPLIELTARALRDVDVIAVVGFSFADADLYISRMVSKAMQASPRTRLLVFDPVRSVVTRIRKKFEVRIPGFDPSRILAVVGDCSETLPQFLRGEFYQGGNAVNAIDTELTNSGMVSVDTTSTEVTSTESTN